MTPAPQQCPPAPGGQQTLTMPAMPLKKIVCLIMLLSVSLYTLVELAVQRTVIMPSFMRLEREQALKDLRRCTEAINRELHHLDTQATDRSAWDDTSNYVADRNESYKKTNLNHESLVNANLNMMCIFNNRRELTDALLRSGDSTRRVNDLAGILDVDLNLLLEHKTLTDSRCGLVQTTMGVMLTTESLLCATI